MYVRADECYLVGSCRLPRRRSWTLTTTTATVVVVRLVTAGRPIRRRSLAARGRWRQLLLRRLPFPPFATPAAAGIPTAPGPRTRVVVAPIDERRGAALGCRCWPLLVVDNVEIERERAGWLPPVARHGRLAAGT